MIYDICNTYFAIFVKFKKRTKQLIIPYAKVQALSDFIHQENVFFLKDLDNKEAYSDWLLTFAIIGLMLFAGQIYVKVFFFILLLFDYIAEKEKVFTPWIKQENLTSGQAYLSGSYYWQISPNQYYCCLSVAKWVSQLLPCFHFGMVFVHCV